MTDSTPPLGRHWHRWTPSWTHRDYPVLSGVATLDDGTRIESTAQIMRVPVLSVWTCVRCGKAKPWAKP